MAVKFLNGVDVVGSMNIVASDVPNLDASKITSGTMAAARMPDLSATYLSSSTADSFTGTYLSFPTLSLGIANNNSDNSHATYFRGSNTHFVLGLTNGNTLYLNYGNTGGTMRTYGTWYHGDTAILSNSRVLSNVTNTNWDAAYGWGNHASASYLTTSGKAADSNLLDGIDSSAFLRSNANDSFNSTLSWGGSFGSDAFDLNGGDIEDARGVRAREFTQIASGIPRNNLGSPTVTEMALFEPQFTCKTDLSNSYDDLADLTFHKQMTSASAWEEVTVSDDQKRRFLRTNNSNVIIPNTAYKFRVEYVGRYYTFGNALYIYWSSNSHNSQVHIWKRRCSDNTWIQHTSATDLVSSWPGHLYLPFSTIPWNETNTTSTGHYNTIRVEFTPNWSGHASYGDRDINLSGGQIWGGYPSGRRTPHYYDQNGKLFTYGDFEVNGKLYVDTLDSNTASTAALVLNGNEIEQRTLGSNAFNSTAYSTFNGAYSSLSGLPTLGTAAATAATAYATSAQGTLATTAHGWGNHATAGYITTDANTQLSDAYVRGLFSGGSNITLSATGVIAGTANTQLSDAYVIGLFTAGTNVEIAANGTISSTDTNTQRAISSTPTDGATTTSISSDWAFDNVKTAVPANAVFTDTVNDFDGAYGSLSGTPTIPSGNAIIDWTADQGTTNIHSGNYTDTDTVYTHPVTAGNKHVPTGGSAGQFLKYSASGTAVWATPSYTTNTNTQLSEEEVRASFEAGTNVAITNGVISSTDTVYDHPTTAGNLHIPTGGAAGQFLKYTASGTAGWATPSYTTNTNTTYTAGTGLTLTGTAFSVTASTYAAAAHTHTPTQAGLGNLSSSGNALAGAFTATGDITAFSDARVKENVETIPNALEKVTALRGVNFNKIGEEKRSTGVIAQEVREVLPEVIHENEDGMLSVAYGNITGVLIEAIKEQQKQIEELKAMVINLKNNKS